MAQVYQMMLGTSGRQWELLTVREDGRMTMTFHGTDREISHEVTENADGWLCYPGAMFPGLESGKWQLMEEEPIAVATKPTLRGQSPCNPSSTSHTGDSPRESGNEWLQSAGYLVAATVALFVIYETGLLIPLGLIGLATSGFLK